MLMTRVFPCLLLKENALVKTVKFSNPKYIGDPINTVEIYNRKEVDELVFLDITATNEKRKPPFETIQEIATECFMPFAYGGGVRDLDDMKKIFSLGAEKVVINTHSVEDPTFIRKAANLFGSQSIVVSIDAKVAHNGTYEAYIKSGTKPTGMSPVELAKKAESLGAGEIFLNSIDKDGTMEGYDLRLIELVSKEVTIPLIACGGAGNVQDLGRAVSAGASAVAAGSIFVYQGKNRSVLINFPRRDELKEILK